MAVQLLVYVLADLCLGKPPLRSLSISSTVADTLAALKSSGDSSFISVWRCDHCPSKHYLCIGMVSVVDIVCYLCRDENLDSLAVALKAPVSALLPEAEGIVRHVDSSSSLLEAIDLILQGTHNLVIPIKSSNWKRKHVTESSTPTWHNGQEFCWLT